jgi:uncharacterized protein
MKQVLINTANRIRIIDIIRGIAVLGIFTMNFSVMSFPAGLSENYSITDPNKGWGYWIGVISDILFLDKMRGLFTLLFGVSAVLIIERLGKKFGGLDAVTIYFRRLVWLLAFGLIHAYILLWSGDVLFHYAILGMLLIPFIKASRKVLVAAILTCLVVLIIQPITDYRDTVELQKQYATIKNKQQSNVNLTIDDQEVLEEWGESIADSQPDDEEIEDEVENKTGDYFDVFDYNKKDVVESETTEFYTNGFWDMILYMFLGIMLFRMNFFDVNIKQAVHFIIALCGTGIGLVVNAWLYLHYYENFSYPVGSLYYLIFVDLGRLPLVLGYTSLIIFLFRLKLLDRMGNWLAETGKMALTNYLMQSIIGAFILYGFGFAQFNQLNRVEIAIIILSVWISQIIFSSLWMRYFNYGPFEWAWRSLTYWKIQPLRVLKSVQSNGGSSAIPRRHRGIYP